MTTTGYSGTPLIRKLGIKEGFKVSVINPPSNYWRLLGRLPADVELLKKSSRRPLDFVHVFATDATALKRQLKTVRNKIVPNGMIWVSWPKKASRVPTDLDGNVIRDLAFRNSLVDVKVCAVDESWSGLKLVIRVKDRA